MSSASRISASGTSLAPHSTIRIGLVGAGDDEIHVGRRAAAPRVGLTTKLPSILPIRTAPTGVGNGMSEIISAADAPFIARMSYGWTWSTDSVRSTELRLTTPALREQRAQRAVDHARDQRRLLAGAALALEEGAGDLARGVHALLDIHRQREEVDVAQVARGGGGEDDGVARRDETAPEACLAILPVSKAISVPPISTETRCTSDMCSFRCPPLGRRAPLHRLDASVVVAAC